MIIGDIQTPSTPNPFADGSNEVRLCWLLGYHDGVNNIDPQVGEDALVSLAIDAGGSLANSEAELASSQARLGQLASERDEANDHVLTTYGKYPIGILPHVMVVVYMALAVIAVAAEFPLSGLTVGVSLRMATRDQMHLFQTFTVWALASMLCLIGFSIKLLVDVFDHDKGRRRLEIGFAVLALCLCVICIVCVAQLRSAIGSEQIAERQVETAGANGSNISNKENQAQLDTAEKNFEKANEEMSKWAALTFMWVTIALPCFSAVCLVVAFHQIRSYRKHNYAVKTLDRVSSELSELTPNHDRLSAAIVADREHLKQIEESSGRVADFEKCATAVYRHGFATGRAVRLEKLGAERPYSRFVKTLNQEVA